MKNIAIIQARMNSTRFPGKILQPLHGKPLIQWIVDAAKKIDLIDEVIVATSDNDQEKPLIEYCKKNNIHVFQGSETDVLSRYYEAAKKYKADNIIRLTADCPLLDPQICSQILYLLIQSKVAYASNVLPPTWPDGLDCEAFTFKTLETAHKKAAKASDREHVTGYITSHQHQFKTANVSCPIPDVSKHRWTVDHEDDLAYLEKLLDKTNGQTSLTKLLQVIDTNSNIKQPVIKRNESYEMQIAQEPINYTEFKTSQSMLQDALKFIPLGSQTFSKSHIQYPEKTSPHFVTHGYGSHIWDVDGNEYVDLVNALLPNILGYADPDVNFAVQAQLQKGVSMSLATNLEMILAEKLCSIIPSAQKVRYGKNGTDVTSAAIRLARAYTSRDMVVVCGYHGWQDWYIGTTTNDQQIYNAVKSLRTHGTVHKSELLKNKPDGPWYYEQQSLGFNYRMTEIQAALGISQLKKLDRFLARRSEIASIYNAQLKVLPVQLPTQIPTSKMSYHLYVICLLKHSRDKAAIFRKFEKRGIGLQVHYIPIYRQPYYASMGFKPENFPHMEEYYTETLSIPNHPMLSEDEQNIVIQALKETLV